MIGIDVKEPDTTCTDPHCPFHGTLPVRGIMITGIVVSTAMDKTVIVQKARKHYIPKYERYEKRSGSYKAHLPPCIPAEKGDTVLIMECRPLSKTKSFVVIEKKIMEKEKEEKEKEEKEEKGKGKEKAPPEEKETKEETVEAPPEEETKEEATPEEEEAKEEEKETTEEIKAEVQ